MKPFEEQFTAWVDGKLSGSELAEFEKELAARPDAMAQKEEALKLGEFLRANSTAPKLTSPDFFNHQLMQRIAAEIHRPQERKRASFWSLPRLAFAGAMSLVLALALFRTTIPSGSPVDEENKYFAQVVEAWPADPTISATTVYNPEDNVTVVWLEGLDYIPATYALK
jgi:anti-sigma factor RsiW